ncbi:glycosyltransferase family 4 protein [Jannaschia aquimarina]|uniref:PimB protein n=1 Tax=Jannaschia aquimarina TaxID=935700 RepID=A0A0D1EIX1_9RHOB|nr:glycosyltransferase family 4 protein [Jannaschia aquimarina]KIT16851.1 GDP-mannose-dependent alpha-(1-6)-phosphatidylinositol monomannoside mannosyltransferase [Jannaschia aquimarina]SNT13032.1 Glycosyltransferase involved in cell wall bisynthesis [Jannaschia aquimarina]
MRIAYLCTDPGIPVFGTKGASVHVQEVCRAFLRRGMDVTLISPRMEGDVPDGLQGLTRMPLPALPGGDAEGRARALLRQNDTVTEVLAKARPFDMIYERHALFAHAGMEYADATGAPGLLEVNAPLIEESRRHRILPLPGEAEVAARRQFLSARAAIAVSSPVADYVRDFGADRVEVIPNGIDPARFPPTAPADGPFTIGFLGTLRPWHDVATIIDALALMERAEPDARVLIVADGPERAALEAQARDLGVADRVKFTGTVRPKDVPGWLAQMHVGVAPYRASDPFYFSPLKLREYMAAGLPGVVSDVGDLAEAVREGGIAVPPDDAETLARILIALAADPDYRHRLGAAGRAHVLAHHSWDRVAGRVLDLARESRVTAGAA